MNMDPNSITKNQYIQNTLQESLLRGDLKAFSRSLPQSHTNAYTESGLSLLSQSVLLNHTEIVQFLLSKGADPNQRSEGGDCPLHFAAVTSAATLSKILLDYGAVSYTHLTLPTNREV